MENTRITIQTIIKKNISQVWKLWTEAEHIVHWNFASDDWHCPAAKNDLQVGGKFVYTMSAKDGSFSFDFSGNYIKIVPLKHIEITLDDNRKVWIDFIEQGNQTSIIEKFEAETENSVELQETGWQMILNNFKKYAESI
ncbi:MAG: hypothetical protein H6Q20_1117 [Bacteroidetes bacterium]|nr:hypothetical protein [Bacteroidota bacterium]